MADLKIYSAQLSDVGHKRPHNEDSYAYWETADPQELNQSGNLYIVADGVGGAAKGERASRYAADKVLFEYYQMPQMPPADRLHQLIRDAGNQIYQYADGESFGRMATTIVATVIRENKLLVAHVGDSRAYLVRDGNIQQLTRDHSLVGEMIRDGTITEEESLHSKVQNRLTRSLGGEENVHIDVTPEIELLPGDRILMCTDGLTRYALPANLLEMVTRRSPVQAVQALIDFANLRGGADNITAIVISIHSQDEKVDWIANAAHERPTLPVWEMDTDESAATHYPRQRRAAVKIWMPMVIIAAALLGMVGIFLVVFQPSPINASLTPSVTPILITVTHQTTITPLPDRSETPMAEILPTLVPIKIELTGTLSAPGSCEITINQSLALNNVSQLNEALALPDSNIDIRCKPDQEAICKDGKLVNMDNIYPGMILIFSNVDPANCLPDRGFFQTPTPPQQ